VYLLLAGDEFVYLLFTGDEFVYLLLTGGISLLIKLLLLQDADVQVAAIYALSVVTAGDDYNCRLAIT